MARSTGPFANDVVLVDPKQDTPQPDPDRSYWIYVQVFPTIATNNTITGALTNDPTLFTPQPIDPSNSLGSPTVLANGDLSPAAAILAAAGSSLRSPEVAAASRRRRRPCMIPGTRPTLPTTRTATTGGPPQGPTRARGGRWIWARA